MEKHKFYSQKINNQGFTIIELLIATVVFSSILLIATIGIIYISKTYVEGQVVIKNQDNTQAILQNLSSAIKFDDNSNHNIVLPMLNSASHNYFFCVGNYEYIYSLNQLFNDRSTSVGLSQLPNNNSPICSYPTVLTGARQLLSQNERIGELNITSSSNIYDITLNIAYGNDSVLQTLGSTASPPSYQYRCTISAFSISLCAVSSLSTIVTPRIGA